MEWKDIHGYEGYYQISEYGNVRSLSRVIVDKRGYNHMISGQPIVGYIDRNGYHVVQLCKYNHKYHFYVHNLVIEHFIGFTVGFSLIDRLTVNHIDGNKNNNHYSNLEWLTHSKNVQHACLLGLNKSRLSADDIIYIRKNWNSENDTYQKYANMFGVSGTTIRRIVTDKSWKHIKV